MDLSTAGELQRWSDANTTRANTTRAHTTRANTTRANTTRASTTRASTARTNALRPPRRYEVISELGGGAMSRVHLAHDTETGRIVVVKCVADDASSMLTDAVQRFAHEASVVAQLHHPNIVQTIAIEREGETPIAIVAEYVRGTSLRDVLATNGPLDVAQTLRVLRDVASALAYTHARRIVHRDVKPGNILIEADGGRALLTDFGIACASGALPALEAGGVTVGTPAYMPPEQVDAKPVDARADVYALCIVAWEMLAGRMPWLGDSLADVFHRQRYESLPDLALVRPDIPVFLLRAINAGLAKDPTQRWRDGAELLRQLSPTPTPTALERIIPATHAPLSALDATVRLTVPDVEAPERVPFAEPDATSTSSRHSTPRRVPVLVSTLVAAALLALASLAPRLTHATEHRAPSVDPELDSMLTLAVASPSSIASRSAASARHACSSGTTSRRASSCAPVTHRTTPRVAGRARHLRGARRTP